MNSRFCSKEGVCIDVNKKVLHSMVAANILSRVRQKCEAIDEIMVKQGEEPKAMKAFASVMNPMLKMCKNAKAAEAIEQTILDPVLESMKKGFTYRECMQAMKAAMELVEKKQKVRTRSS